MANSPQAIKRARQTIKRTLHNASQRSEMRTAIKKALKAIQSKDDAAAEAVKQATVLVDRLSGRRVIHPNKGARIKRRLVHRLKAANDK